MRRISIIVLTALSFCSCRQADKKQAVANTLPFYTSADFTPRWIESTSPEYKNIHSIPSFSFTDQNGETVNEKTFDGKIYVADFFFTSCPGICKKLTANLSLVQKEFLNDDKVLLISHSVTPDTDSVARLKNYAMNNNVMNHKWRLVTGNKNEIYSIARESYFADEDMGVKKDANDFLHTENMLLIDKHRRIRGVYKGTSVAEINNLIADIKTLELEE